MNTTSRFNDFNLLDCAEHLKPGKNDQIEQIY